MPTTIIDKDFITIKVPKSIGNARIKRIKEFALALEKKRLPLLKKYRNELLTNYQEK